MPSQLDRDRDALEQGRMPDDDDENDNDNDDDDHDNDDKGELPWLLCPGRHHLPPLGRRAAKVRPFY